MAFTSEKEENAYPQKRKKGCGYSNTCSLWTGFPIRSARGIDHPEPELVPVAGHHLLFHLLAVQGVEAVAGKSIGSFSNLFLDELLVPDRAFEGLFLKAVFSFIEVISHDIGGNIL